MTRTQGTAEPKARPGTVGQSTAADAERLRAQRLLAVLGRLGASVREALVARVDPSVVGNVDVLVLVTLDIEGALRPTEVAALTGMSSSGVTKLLDRLEGRGHIERQLGAVPGDRRATRVVLTTEGRRVARELAAGLDSRMDLVRESIAELRSIVGD
jgi:DNA-binding MarR family transcriptional regulator